MKIGMIQKFSGGTLYYSRIKGEVMVNRITNARFKQKLIPLEQELFQEYGNSSGYDFWWWNTTVYTFENYAVPLEFFCWPTRGSIRFLC